jgi:ArsR family metal-binding transcriptional regulator
MLLNSYKKELFRAKCNPLFKSLHCYAHLEDDIGDVIPYLNTVFGGTAYQRNPPSVMFQNNGRLIAVHSRKIAINALEDEAEADRILNWITGEINKIWENRDEIKPSEFVPEKPKVFEVLKLLPKTNCGECGQPTCMVFSTLVAQGVKDANDCPQIDSENKKLLEFYLGKMEEALSR